MQANIVQFALVLLLVITLVAAESRIICTRKNGVQQRSFCRPRFASLKNNEYKSMLQAIADRRVALSGSLAALREPSNAQIFEQVDQPQLSYQDIMHNLLMKTR